MSNTNGGPFDASQPVWQLWWDFLSKSAAAGLSFPPGGAVPDGARSARAGLFQAWADGWQQFMRSPEFLEGMAKAQAAGLQARQQLLDLLGQRNTRRRASAGRISISSCVNCGGSMSKPARPWAGSPTAWPI